MIPADTSLVLSLWFYLWFIIREPSLFIGGLSAEYMIINRTEAIEYSRYIWYNLVYIELYSTSQELRTLFMFCADLLKFCTLKFTHIFSGFHYTLKLLPLLHLYQNKMDWWRHKALLVCHSKVINKSVHLTPVFRVSNNDDASRSGDATDTKMVNI